ncbi:DUF2000 domain-containing protein [Serratia sp. FDAARGOS_506]|uniref:DUF2000 domain-containing protein n=1 Tax=Serratia sp. FDAARGOS_506 TaxID=2420306 RepID=UPI000F50FCC4|nr:DUF2000 domain-containing protein [Serratia sp. FDAARGOS_506]AYZ31848.1 DUF2000 domain-containing protein [Serratia sp. FDAARGOS_506]
MTENKVTQNISQEKCVIILNNDLPLGQAANAAAVIALTIGQRHPELVGSPLIDATNVSHPGLIPIGVTVLSTSVETMRNVREKACELLHIDLIDFPIQGQQTKDYDAFLHAVSKTPLPDMIYSGLALVGNKKAISKLVAKLDLFG